MFKNDPLFRDIEEDYAIAIAQAVHKALDLDPVNNLADAITEAENELEWYKARAWNAARAIKAFKALRPAKPRKEQARAKARQTYDDMLIVMDILLEAGVSMSTEEIVTYGLDIPESRLRYALEILALDEKISLGPNGWEIQGLDESSDTAD